MKIVKKNKLLHKEILLTKLILKPLVKKIQYTKINKLMIQQKDYNLKVLVVKIALFIKTDKTILNLKKFN